MVNPLKALNARDWIGLLGIALTTVGAYQAYPPAGYLTPGLLCLALAVYWRGR